MKTEITQINLLFAWLWILLGFISGLVLGMLFHRENWLGGYASFPRRMYRLGHISFFGLGGLNLMFCFTVRYFMLTGSMIHWASLAFVIGAITMPIGCAIMARFPKATMIYSVPVVSLITGAILTIWQLLKL